MFENLNPLDKSTAIFEIVIMLVVAFIIGYLTRWFANRNKTQPVESNDSINNKNKEIKQYQDKIEKLNSELGKTKAKLLENEKLNSEIDNLKTKLLKQESSCNELKEELQEHEKLNYELTHKLNKPAPKFKSKEEAAEVLGFKFTDEAHKEDLTIIKGIGPFIQEKLNELGIYTIEQISDFTISTVTKVSDAIEYFPGRIQRDFWVEQANEITSDRKEQQKKD